MGQRKSNTYYILLPFEGRGGDKACSNEVTDSSPTGDASVTQTIKEPETELPPVVPRGDEELTSFWINTSFKCFGQHPRPLKNRHLRALKACLHRLDRTYAPSLVRFYTHRPLDNKEPIYSSRCHSPERLVLNLERQLAFARQLHPLANPLPAEFTLFEICSGLRDLYDGCYLPHTLAQFYKDDTFRCVREEVIASLSKRNTGDGAG